MLTALYFLGALLIAVLVLRIDAIRRRNLRQRTNVNWARWVYDESGNPIDYGALEVPIFPRCRRIRLKKQLRILSTDHRRTFSRRWVNYRRSCI